MSAEDFEHHLRYLKRHYKVVSLSSAVSQFQSDGKVPSHTAVITIDDGYRDAYEVAFPLLHKYQMPAAIFVVTDFLDHNIWLWTDKLRFVLIRTQKQHFEYQLGETFIKRELTDRRSRLDAAAVINSYLKSIGNNEKDKAIDELSRFFDVPIPEQPTTEFEPLKWDELRKLERGGIEIGSHTRTHPILTKIPLAQVRWELRTSKARMEEMLGHEVPLFCYPNGIHNSDIRQETRLSGYTSAVSASPGFCDAEDDLFALRRISAERDLPHFAQDTSGFEGFKNYLRDRQL